MSLFFKRIIVLLHLTSVIAIAQKQFSVKIQFPENIDNSRIKILYDNGKEEINIQPKFRGNQIVLSGKYYSKYADIVIDYSSDTLTYHNTFWVASKPAFLSLVTEKETLRCDKAENVYDIMQMGASDFNKFVAIEDKDFFEFILRNNTNMNDSLAKIAYAKGKTLSNKKLEFIKNNGNSYYSFWLFRKEAVFADTSVDTLIKIYKTVFPVDFINSQEGTEITKILTGRNLKKKSQAPVFIAKDISGKTISLEKYKNKFILLAFWASWCGPCVEEIPTISLMREKYSTDKFEIISVTLDDNLTQFSEAIKKYNMNWKHIYGDKDLVKKYGVIGIPEIYLIDKTGKIIYKREEEKDFTPKLPILEAILKEKL
ncbi:MAG: TlpA family protein disulfide reductase [Emticicia sp.]|uniref:TlpA family protein disulfide reductase n=1 Tax=Emticicia sp. TaxID=1930953 RepID=UPI003BA4443E